MPRQPLTEIFPWPPERPCRINQRTLDSSYLRWARQFVRVHHWLFLHLRDGSPLVPCFFEESVYWEARGGLKAYARLVEPQPAKLETLGQMRVGDTSQIYLIMMSHRGVVYTYDEHLGMVILGKNVQEYFSIGLEKLYVALENFFASESEREENESRGLACCSLRGMSLFTPRTEKELYDLKEPEPPRDAVARSYFSQCEYSRPHQTAESTVTNEKSPLLKTSRKTLMERWQHWVKSQIFR